MSSSVINMLFDPAVLAAVENWEQTTSQQQFLSPMMQSLASSLRVSAMPWSGEHRGFAVRTYFKNGRSVIATQRAFRLHFNIPRHGPIPDGKAIRHWIEALEDNGSTRRPRVSKFGVIGPYFFEEDGRSVTVNSQRYLAMLEDFFEPKLEELSEETNLGDIWFQQDGATALTAQVAMVKLRQMFPARLVSRRGDVEWSPRSPDLSICDFFLWGYLKEKVFRGRPHNLEELKMRIWEEIAVILLEMCQRAAENFRHRLQQCIATEGHHLPDAIFKK
ncbi:hypothetical protein O3P69_004027 [Scylla paramamosain]|uniref:DUF4817 domain-containing protein n=1 Tax=Scylla paramamosain TaxID=85552 RepID=A0AAW0UEN0_SCYPA